MKIVITTLLLDLLRSSISPAFVEASPNSKCPKGKAGKRAKNNPNDPTATGAQLVDVGQSCCGECWCIQDGAECPLRTTAFPQLYTEAMVSDFGQKALVDPDTFEVSSPKQQFVCNRMRSIRRCLQVHQPSLESI